MECKEAVYSVQVQHKIYLKIPPLIYCANISAISLASDPVYHAHTKHIKVEYHFIRKRVICGDIQLRFVNLVDQPADIFTKGLSSVRFQMIKNKLCIIDRPFSFQGVLT